MTNARRDENLSYIQWKAWSADTFGKVSPEDDLLFTCEVRRAGVDLGKTSRVLEIGFGNGSFAAWVLRQTPHYVGTENNERLVERALAAGIEAYPATTDLTSIAKGRSFDLIAVFDVLEHLDMVEITKLLDASCRCLSPDGRLVIRVPSGDSPFSGRLMHGDITHKTCLGTLAFQQLAVLGGLEVVTIRDSAFPVLGLGVVSSMVRFIIAIARALFSSMIRIVYFGNKSAVISPNLVAILRRSGTKNTLIHDAPDNHTQDSG